MSVTVLIPCKNEEEIISQTISLIQVKLLETDYEILVVDDFSEDLTFEIVTKMSKNDNKIRIIKNKNLGGLGEAIRNGIENSSKDFICFFMADQSDSVDDLVSYIDIISKNNFQAVLGSRFVTNSSVHNYPYKKLVLNRFFNKLVQLLFLSRYNDFTNAFKIYKKKTLMSIYPLVSENFNIFLEIPLKIVYRGYNYKVIPISWNNRKSGNAKFKIRELGSKYFFTLFYCFLEKILLKKNKN